MLKRMESFEKYLQKECGGYPLRTIIDNLLDDQIEESVVEYFDLCKNELLDSLISKYKTQRQTIDSVVSHPDSVNENMEVQLACRRFISGFIKELEDLKKIKKCIDI